MTTGPDEPHVLLGAYVLGGLSDDDHRTFSEHLRTCSECQTELGQVSGLPHLLDLIDPTEVVSVVGSPGTAHDGTEAPTAASARVDRDPVLDTGAAQLLTEVGRRRRRRRAWFAGVASAAAVVLFAAGVWLGPRLFTSPAPPTAHFTAASAAGSSATADVALVTRGWGTQIDLACEDIPAGEVVELWVVDAAGHRTPVASWKGTQSGYATVTGATSLHPNEIRAVEIRTDTGTVLASAQT